MSEAGKLSDGTGPERRGAGDANARAGDANTQASDANAQAEDANAQVGDVSARAGEVNARAARAVAPSAELGSAASTPLDDAVKLIRATPAEAVAAFDLSAVIARIPKPGKRTDPDSRALLNGFVNPETLDAAAFDDAADLGERVFRKHLYGYLYPEAWRLIREHQRAGHRVRLVSALPEFAVAPVARTLGIEEIVAEPGAVDFAYAQGGSNPLLTNARFATAINAKGSRGLTFHPRRAPRIRDYLRTIVASIGLILGSLVGIARKATTRKRQAMADGLMHDATTATLAGLGVRLRVVGAENASSPRPAVFLFNHQSQLDVIIVPKVLGGNVTGVGKQELTKHPVFGPIMRFVGVTFIDRSDTAKAKAALAPVVSTLRGGLSIAIAPEGTRSYTPGLGEFKKGAFHMAMQAGVPVIPVVIRNAGEIMWRDSPIGRSGVVDVAILPPIDVSAWKPSELDRNVAAVRNVFEDTLLSWPTDLT
ncbi:lysophospholipid acyltransferase family protein [Nocardia camponoti]|uniref:1-acyl-sn-glycerol-3-phosphate acyltransferase n=1 Tax=Nocardia camponoti TaxID=1616106 RepID=A0A917QMA3_9NOCA|nr:lysophospholipid acyltransferase family protein [Nocardia camponoti]GGK58801.1 hypothetical protein GCM10011591_33770 [Nocardia camponoti]